MKSVDFYFDFSCPYAYLGSTQLRGLAERTGAEIRLKPMLLGGVFRANEVPQNLAASLGPAKAKHNMQDLDRHAAMWDVPYRMPSGHPFRTVEALRSMLVVGAPFDDLMERFYRAYWVDGRDIGDKDVVVEVLKAAGHDGAAVLAATQDPAIKDELRQRTDEAIAKGIFGAPAFVVADELYWGQDRIAEVERALNPEADVRRPAADALHPVDFYFDFSSPFACMGIQRVDAIFGDAATWRPMLLGAVFKAIKMVNIPVFSFSPSKRRWYKRDLERQAEHVGFDFQWPSRFPMNTVLPLRVAVQVQEASPAAYRSFCRKIFAAYWTHGDDISQASVIAAICDDCGLDGQALVEATSKPDVKEALRNVTGRAIEAGVFGAPSSVVHAPGRPPELFWGADRMELAYRYAAGRLF